MPITFAIGDFSERPYRFLEHGEERRLSEKEENETKPQCDKAFDEFEPVRGRVLGKAITIETIVARIITCYYCPQISYDPATGETRIHLLGPENLRHSEFLDRIMFDSGFSFRNKNRVLCNIVKDLADTLPVKSDKKKPVHKALGPALKRVGETRNLFAHSLVGIDIDSREVALWKRNAWVTINGTYVKKYELNCKNVSEILSRVGQDILHPPRYDKRHIKPF